MPDIPDSESPYELAPKAPQATSPVEPVDIPIQPLRPAVVMPPSSTPAAPAQPWNCIICGFHADAKPRRGVCPECGAPADPRGTGLLQYSIPSWVHYLATGTLVLFFGILLHVIGVIVAYGWDAYRPGVLLKLAATILEFTGIMILTAREPHPQATPSPLALPARLAGLVALFLVATLAWLAFRKPDAPSTGIISLNLFVTGTLAFLVGFQVRHLALRVPSDAIAAHTLNVAWIIALACILIAVALFTGLAGAVNDSPGKLFMFTVPMIAVLFIVVVWAEWILLRLFLNLRDCAIAAATPPRKRPAPKPPGI